MIEQAIQSMILADASFNAIAGNAVFYNKAPQKAALPYVILSRISAQRILSFAGYSGLTAPRVQVDCYATTYTQVRKMADVIRLAINGFRGTVLGKEIQGVFLEDDRDSYEPPEHGDEVGVHRVSNDYFVWFKEAVT